MRVEPGAPADAADPEGRTLTHRRGGVPEGGRGGPWGSSVRLPGGPSGGGVYFLTRCQSRGYGAKNNLLND